MVGTNEIMSYVNEAHSRCAQGDTAGAMEALEELAEELGRDILPSNRPNLAGVPI